MTSYLIVRTGSNAANQSMTQRMGVAIIEADTEEQALSEAEEMVDCHCYANQFLSAYSEDEVDEDDDLFALWDAYLEAEAHRRAYE